MKDTEIRNFTIFTQHGREPLNDISILDQRLKSLASERKGFVRLEMTPPIDGKRFLETIWDNEAQNFYVSILEDREEGQGFLELRSKKVPKRMYKSLFKRQHFGLFALRPFVSKLTGIQKSVVAEGVEEDLYMAPFEIKSAVFNEDVQYGGSQGNPMNVFHYTDEGMAIWGIVEKYFPEYNEKQIKAFLKKLDSEGCGYVVVVNMVFSHFEGREAEFEQKFGFPMYAKNGKLNYDYFLVDFYSATDNHYLKNGVDTINYEEDQKESEKVSDYDYTMDTTGYGTTQEARNYRMHLYLKDKNVNVKITNYAIMYPGKLKELTQKGYVMISLKNGNVQNEDGTPYHYVEGHAMIITGITSDCRYIVSSWGKKYYVDPNEVVEKDGKKTKIYYQYFEFE